MGFNDLKKLLYSALPGVKNQPHTIFSWESLTFQDVEETIRAENELMEKAVRYVNLTGENIIDVADRARMEEKNTSRKAADIIDGWITKRMEDLKGDGNELDRGIL